MGFRRAFQSCACSLVVALVLPALPVHSPAQSSQSSSSSSSSKPVRKPASVETSPLDSGAVSHGIYRNPAFGFACKIPAAWVLRTEEMNARDDASSAKEDRAALDPTAEGGCARTGGCGRVLLAAFSRPPLAPGEDVNSSIVIAAENAAAIPELKEAAQYFGLVNKAAEAQGFDLDDNPYEFVIGTKKVVRGDFQKDIGTRVMRQSTLVVLARGYALSFTFLGGTEDEVEELIAGLSFGAGATAHPH
jgi:hypothetical protein